jgi:hypothetical protein
LKKNLETAADIYTFIMFNMGVTPSAMSVGTKE